MKDTIPNIDRLKPQIEALYAKWGIHKQFLKDNQTTTPANFLKFLEEIEIMIPEMNCRVMPSSFNPNDEKMLAFPYNLAPSWDSCQRALSAFNAVGVMVRLPLFWQIESNLHVACRAVGAFVFLNEPENMPVGAMAIKTAEINVIVTSASDALDFSSYLSQNGYEQNPSWLVIYGIEEHIGNLPKLLRQNKTKVAQEIHIFPGIPVLEQCPELYPKKEQLFHVSDEFWAESTGDGILITSAVNHPLPFFRYELPAKFLKVDQCTCGKETFAV